MAFIKPIIYMLPICTMFAGCSALDYDAHNLQGNYKKSAVVETIVKSKKINKLEKPELKTSSEKPVKNEEPTKPTVSEQQSQVQPNEETPLLDEHAIQKVEQTGPSAATPPPMQTTNKTNTISIPNIVNASFVNGHTQADVDNNDICLLNQIASTFGSGQPILMCGHNYRSLANMSSTTVGTIITINYGHVQYKYRVIESLYCLEDEINDDFVDLNGVRHLERFTGREVLQIYTCHGSNPDGRWFVKAIRV